MEKVRLGKTNLMVSRVGLGGLPIQRLSEERAVSVIRRCLDLGVNFIDTSSWYTGSEEHIGKAIAGRRDEVILCTKTPTKEKAAVEKQLKLSLEHFGTDALDVFGFHNISTMTNYAKVTQPGGPIAVVQEAVKAGVVKYTHISSHNLDVAKEAVRSGLFDTIMFPFNFICREQGEELLADVEKRDMGFLAMKPLEGGMLERADLAIKYLLRYPNVIPVVGISKEEEIEEIVRIVNGSWELTETEKAEIQRMQVELGTQFCRRCDYCQPCPEGIPISTIMHLKSALKRYSYEQVFNPSELHFNAVEKAMSCTKCGECEDKCPYHLSIRDIMDEYTDLYRSERQRYQREIAPKA